MKKLLLLTLALVVCMGAMAGDWSLPVPKSVPLEYDKAMYFYNTEAKQFLTRGNAWGAQMSLGETGLPVIVKAKTDTLYNDGGTYVMLWNDKDKAYFDWDANGRQGWVDRAEAEALVSEKAVWKLLVNAEGTFQFGIPNRTTICEHPDFDENGSEENLWAGWNGSPGNTEVVVYLDTKFYENSGVTWVAVSEDEYNAFVPTYALRVSLYNQLVKADEEEISVPSSVGATFNDATATADELKAAIEQMGNLIMKHDIETKGEADMTAQYIVNPNLDNQNAGWSNSTGESWWNTDDWHFRPEGFENVEANSSMNGFLCRFVWSGGWLGNLPNTESTQTFTLPAGSYRLEADCVGFQEGDGADAYASPQDWTGQIKGLYLFAKNELGEVRTEIETAGKMSKRFAVEFKSAGGETTIGLKVQDAFGSFIGGDNFRLYCTGLMASPNIVELQTIADDMRRIVESYTEAPFSIESLILAETFLTDAETAINIEDDDTSVKLISDGRILMDTIAKETKAYQRVRDAYNEAIDNIETGEFELFGDEIVAEIRDNAIAMIDPIEQGKVTIEESQTLIDEYISKLAHIIANDVNTVDDGLDATCLLQNGQFSRGKDITGAGAEALPGWNGPCPMTYNVKGAAAGQIEYIGQDFDLWQELKNMPAGVYTIEFRGFYRWGQKDAVVAAMDMPEGEANNVSRFYMNDFAAPIKSITEDARPLGEGDQEGNGMYPIGKTDEEGNELYMPDATWYYMWRNTDCQINRGAVLVEEGQSLRIGFRASGTDSERWSLISAPKLRYEGTSERAMALLDPTAISAPAAAIPATAGVYNLNGQRISVPQRGINIVVTKQADGTMTAKKIMVK